MKHNFAIFILSHGRPQNIHTLDALKKSNYTGDVYIIVDNEDSKLDEYKQIHKEKVIVFDKQEIAKTFDTADNSSNRKTIVFARNASFEIAKQLNLDYFMQLDDDYTSFRYTADENWNYLTQRPIISNFDKLVDNLVTFLENTPTTTIAMSQGGDFIGGESSSVFKKRLSRKAMNSFVCSVKKPFQFVGRINEDVNTYTWLQSTGSLFFTFARYRLEQKQTQSNDGGMTDVYLDSGTYIKSFYTVMFQPSSTKIRLMGNNQSQSKTAKRLHHHIDWDKSVPKIISEIHKKVA